MTLDDRDARTEPNGAGLHLPHVADEAREALQWTQHRLTPAWRKVSSGEARWPAAVAVIVAIMLQLVLPPRLTLGRTWIIPAAEGVLLAGLIIVTPGRIARRTRRTRVFSLGLIAAMTTTNTWSVGRLVRGLVRGTEGSDPTKLLTTGAAIWLTNIVVFCLWYWEFDRGGPGARAEATDPHPDFVFPQMMSPDLAPHEWQPTFVDYLYLSFTNATAFSPTLRPRIASSRFEVLHELRVTREGPGSPSPIRPRSVELPPLADLDGAGQARARPRSVVRGGNDGHGLPCCQGSTLLSVRPAES